MWIERRSINRVKCRLSRNIIPLVSHVLCTCRSFKLSMRDRCAIRERSLHLPLLFLRDRCFEFSFRVNFREYMQFRSIKLKPDKYLSYFKCVNHISCNNTHQEWSLNALKIYSLKRIFRMESMVKHTAFSLG